MYMYRYMYPISKDLGTIIQSKQPFINGFVLGRGLGKSEPRCFLVPFNILFIKFIKFVKKGHKNEEDFQLSTASFW